VEIEERQRGGLRCLALAEAGGARAEIALNGAQLLSWVPAGGREWLFLSRRSLLQEGETVRGGVPVMFPQFADRGALPKHGFVRSLPWELCSAGSGGVSLELCDSEYTRSLWPHAFRAQLDVELDAQTLQVTLHVQNTGDEAFSFTTALHSYFRVADVRRTAVLGLERVRYLDKTLGMQEFAQQDPVVRVDGELDRVYRQVAGAVVLVDENAARRLRITAHGFDDVVTWNPWQELAEELPDMDPAEYADMLCIEAAQAVDAVELEPGGHWRGVQLLEQLAAGVPSL
jgi:glucose-6-phosphate 1-epimerase